MILLYFVCAGGTIQKRISYLTPNASAFPLPLLCHLSNRNDRGLEPEGTP